MRPARSGRLGRQDRSRVLEELCDDYPHLELTTIAHTLQASQFNEEETRAALKMQEEEAREMAERVKRQRKQSAVFMHFSEPNGDMERPRRKNRGSGGELLLASASSTAATGPVFVANSSNTAARRLSVQEDSLTAATAMLSSQPTTVEDSCLHEDDISPTAEEAKTVNESAEADGELIL